MKVNELSKAIADELTLLQETSTQAVKQAARETASEIRDDIRSSASSMIGGKGRYAKSWRTKLTEESMTSVTYTVHAGPDGYRLAHLLEFGHAKRGGGRTKAISHIKPAEERGIQTFENRIRSRLK